LPFLQNEKHPLWKGDDVGYACLHKWVRRHKPKPELCEMCNKALPTELANISGEYKRDINDFQWLCHKCHMKQDNSGRHPSLIFSAENMKDLGFDLYGIGSIAKISKHNREEIKTRIKLVKNIVNKRLHVFGVTSIDLMQFFKEIGVYSIDSTTPIKEAIYSGIIYSNPFRRFKISTKHFRDEWSKKYGFSNILNTPLKCNCPVCNLDPELIMKRGKKVLNNLRAVHNYYHLKKLIEDY